MAQNASYGLLKSSIGKKVFMALTGLFLCLFLVGHLAGNLQLLLPAENADNTFVAKSLTGDSLEKNFARDQFNTYAKFMTTNPLVKILSYVTYFSILFHVFDGLALTIKNRKARPQRYHYKKDSANSIWSSRNMGVLGTVILVFIVLHMSNFWFKMHFGPIETYNLDGDLVKDLYTVVAASFEQLWYVAIYAISMVAIGFHLWHGFASGFQSLGLNHSAYTPLIQGFGKVFAVVVPLGFAIIPIYMYLT